MAKKTVAESEEVVENEIEVTCSVCNGTGLDSDRANFCTNCAGHGLVAVEAEEE